jgi:rod shape-determining protein MreC
MTYLPRDSGAAIGDTVLTSGGNVFPKGLKIGSIKEIRQEDHGVSLYAVIEPFAFAYGVKDVFVITSFEGQGVMIGDDLMGSAAESQPEAESSLESESSSTEAGQ